MNKKDKYYMMNDSISEDEMRDMEFATPKMSMGNMVDLYIYLDSKSERPSPSMVCVDDVKSEREMLSGLIVRLNNDINTIGWTAKDSK